MVNEAAGAYRIGYQVTYVPGGRRSRARQLCRRGVVTGETVFDRYTETTWVPVRGEGRADDAEPDWVRADTIIDVVAAP